MNKFGLVLNDWERNVVQIALTHLEEMHEDIKDENPELSNKVINTCKELLISLK
jgi:uncharacterized protein (DUF302 family)